VLQPLFFPPTNESALEELLRLLHDNGFDFSAKDHYGRTFGHVWQSQGLGPAKNILCKRVDQTAFWCRDAFGFQYGRATMHMPFGRRAQHSKQPTSPSIDIDWHEEDEFVRLIVKAASRNAGAEDDRGRHGLHALALARLPMVGVETKISTKAHVPLSKRLECFELLLNAQVDVNHYDKDGQTALMAFVASLADGNGDKILEQMLRSLVSRGANVNARNRHGERALHVAVRNGRKFHLRTLLQIGANPYACNLQGLSPLQLCESFTTSPRTTGS
jgi:ankyrin repeat protein